MDDMTVYHCEHHTTQNVLNVILISTWFQRNKLSVHTISKRMNEKTFRSAKGTVCKSCGFFLNIDLENIL